MSKRKIDPASIKFDDDTVVEDIDLAEEEIIVDGQRLTDERADEITADVLAKVRARNLIPGGKSLSGDGTHSPIVQTRVPAEVRAKLQQIAERRGVRTSKLLREAIDQFIEREAG
ncbi:ribbon-helix-helix domain-containing protein [Mycobacterium avium subsp. hominissuis]|jgi:hypothetical protein|uniref:ribbon-helix-helix domain-containing protein n=1 Tax=Mycobacterium avium TaxID=1764 RepID=UPI00079FEE0F|nr:ribbon-helix-helix domain-containing protein [Mycobacterium avium]MCA4760894.1 ribbon-helix-helix domain-containing protein [Mycobacterium avium subsp. hominissuis]